MHKVMCEGTNHTTESLSLFIFYQLDKADISRIVLYILGSAYLRTSP